VTPVRPVIAIVGSNRTVSGCPCGQVAGSSIRAIGRTTSKRVPQVRQRIS
jgi:hypothetical protein